jgi:hypothetical protein
VALAAMAAFQLTARVVSSNHDISSDAFNAIFLAWTLPLLVLLGFETYRRSNETRRAQPPESPLAAAGHQPARPC